MSPRTKENFKTIRGESKKKILDTATELFAEKGFNATSINDITIKANISKGLLYHYFKSKYDLLDFIVFEGFNEMDNILNSLTETENSPLDTFNNLLKSTFESLQEKPEFWKLITGLSFKIEIKSRYKKQIDKRKERYLQVGIKLFQQLKTKNPLSDLLFVGAIIDGMAFHYLEEPENYPVEMMLEVFKEKLKILYG